MNQQTKYSTQGTVEVAQFLDSVDAIRAEHKGDSRPTEAVLDSITSSQSNVKVPKYLGEILDKVGDRKAADGSAYGEKVLDAVSIGMKRYEQEHGTAPTADLIEAALQQGSAAFASKDPITGQILDSVLNSASSAHHDPQSLQPNRAVIAILSAITEAIPFAGYLPVDIGSNEGKLAILSHTAGTTYGDYASGSLMDGTSAGNVYGSSARMAKFDVSGTAPFTKQITQTNLASDPGYCDPAGTGVPVLRGRTVIYLNGKPAARDAFGGSSSTSAISGSTTVNGTTYTVTGTVTIATGALSISVSPTLPVDNSILVTAQAFVDYEAAPSLIPSVEVRADTFNLFANPWRVMTSLSIDAAGQLSNELGLDGNAEAMVAIRAQIAMERHYKALNMAAALGRNNQLTYDYNFTERFALMNRAQIWQDFQSTLANADQKMANDTMDHGITHLYVGSWLAAEWSALGADQFQPSGVAARPGVYRVGRLFGKYDVYYTPKIASQATTLETAQIIAVGRSSQVARNPIILGDAISSTFLDLNMLSDLKRRGAVYARDFTEVNPHEPSAAGCALINVTNLK